MLIRPFFIEVVKQLFHLVKPIGKACKIDLLYIINTHKMRCLTSTLFLLLLLFLSFESTSQENVPGKKETPAELNKAASNLEKSLIKNDNLQIARDYELLAQEYADKDDPAKAEEFFNKAREVYAAANNPAAKARVLRNIAQVQELQNKKKAAARNYSAAAKAATDSVSKALNRNDFNRLKYSGKREFENRYLNSNIILLKKGSRKKEVADAYMQSGRLNLKYNDSIAALKSFKEALPYARSSLAKTNKIYNEIIKLHVAGERYEEAISTIEEMLSLARKNNDYETLVTQLQYIAALYLKVNDGDSAVNALQESHTFAAANGMTFQAKESIMLLAEYYKSIGDDKAAMALHEQFLDNLDRIILSDRSLTNAKTFKVTEERIRRLENEKIFRDELITRKNTFNYLLLGSMVLLLLLLGFIVKALYSIKIKNKKIALQSLRREMNPHFIFNSLNSVNHFIATNNELEANKYLTSYSNLMRNTMENSNKDFVTLGNEIDNLTKYLELEHLRFKDKFKFEIKVDEKLDCETMWVPNMIIQPHLENAIWHGLRYKEEKGLLKIDFLLQEEKIIIRIDDNGIGPTKSRELKTHNQKAHKSRGVTNTMERITLLNQLYKTHITFSMTEKESPETGTIVQIASPIITKP